jgi:hypothetical protein
MTIYVDREFSPATWEQLDVQQQVRVLVHARTTRNACVPPFRGWREFSLAEIAQLRLEITNGDVELVIVD